MNTVNRVVIVVLLLIAMVLCSLSFVVPMRVLTMVSQQSAGLVDFLDRVRPVVRLPLGILFALTADLVLLLLVFLEMRRPRRKAIRVQQTTGGEVMMSVDSIAERLNYEIDRLPGVLRSKTFVSSKRGGVVVELDVKMAADSNIPQKAERIVDAAREVVEETMGLKLARPPKVSLRAVPRPRPGAPEKPEEQPPSVSAAEEAEREA